MYPKARDVPWYIHSDYPVFLPEHSALFATPDEFNSFVKEELAHKPQSAVKEESTWDNDSDEDDDTATLVSAPSTTLEIREDIEKIDVNPEKAQVEGKEDQNDQPFMKALSSGNEAQSRNMENMMLTDNQDVAYQSTSQPHVDLFFELEDVVTGPRLRELLEAAWRTDPLMTLKIIFNARSIHLGKSSRKPTYLSMGWLAREHPVTFITNLQWLSRPVIGKKMEKKEDEEDDDTVMVEPEKDDNDPTRFDVRNGVAHGYWKDLLNLLALAVNEDLDGLADPRSVLNDHGVKKRGDRVWDASAAKELRKEKRDNRHTAALKAFLNRPSYLVLHLTVARLFAAQLKSDLALLRDGNSASRRNISLCAKWAPTSKGFHDRHTFVVSSIAEILHPHSEFPLVEDRETYLNEAREAYRKDVSKLRKALGVVERDISAETFSNIKYERVPSLAMNRYASLFAQKDLTRFEDYIDKVAEGKKQISGATLLPSTLVKVALEGSPSTGSKRRSVKQMVEAKMTDIDAKVVDGQWKTLVQRIKDSGKLENSIAVCDVSGSMQSPTFSDRTTPLDSSIGLSLLLAEITQPPFGGAFITFSAKPKFQQIDLSKTLQEKVRQLNSADWDMNTDFVAVFEDLILPLARKHNVKQEDMVKQIFVFSDMHFDSASSDSERWTTSFERIKEKYETYGYKMPNLIFWNLAGGKGGGLSAPKPADSSEQGTALVSGYSQGMLKTFLDNGSFEDPEEEDEIETQDEDGAVKVEKVKKQKMDPLSTVKKAISHKAYDMLKVVD